MGAFGVRDGTGRARRIIRRQRRLVCLCLVAGAVLNVLIAWACKFYNYVTYYQPPLVVQDSYYVFETERAVHTMRWRGGGIAIFRARDITPDLTLLAALGYEPADVMARQIARAEGNTGTVPGWVRLPEIGAHLRTSTSCGWPLPSLVAYIDEPDAGPTDRAWAWTPTDWRPASKAGMVANLLVLPLRPIWPNTLVNTALYATVLWVLIAVPISVWRMVRRRAGRCADCGYDMQGLMRCPECGGCRGNGPTVRRGS